MSEPGTLYIVPTPIGNLSDITERALTVFKEVDAIAAEDTRHTRKLLEHYGVQVPVFAFHDHNEKAKAEQLIERVINGESIALVSDAGTPLISDPGYALVSLCRKQNVKVTSLPGACALTVALSGAGLPTDSFQFEGFLPSKPAQRRAKLESLVNTPRTLVFYESPYRILHTLEAMADIFEDERQVVLARELTKQFETYLTGSAGELITRLNEDPNQQRGEMVLLVEPFQAPKDTSGPGEDAKRTLQILLEELPLKKAAALSAKLHGERKNELYQWALSQKNND